MGQTANKQSAQSVNEFYSMSEGKDAMKSRYKAEVGVAGMPERRFCWQMGWSGWASLRK